jgi:hypothetical protein
LLSHLAKIGDTWEDFLCRNNFTLPENIVKSPLLFDTNPSPCNPTIENQSVDPHGDHATTERNSVAMKKPLGKKPRYNFMPRKLLEGVIDVLKERVSPSPTFEPNQGFFNKPIVNKNRKQKKHGNLDLSFVNKRPGMLISRNLRNRQQDHLISIPVIEVDDHLSDDEINEFLSREYVDKQCLGNEIYIQDIQYDFVSEIPPFLKNQEGFAGISHDLKQAIENTKAPIAEHTQPLPAIAPVHCENCLDWVERYYKYIPYHQAQLRHMVAQNSLLERENQELKACVQSNAD